MTPSIDRKRLSLALAGAACLALFPLLRAGRTDAPSPAPSASPPAACPAAESPAPDRPDGEPGPAIASTVSGAVEEPDLGSLIDGPTAAIRAAAARRLATRATVSAAALPTLRARIEDEADLDVVDAIRSAIVLLEGRLGREALRCRIEVVERSPDGRDLTLAVSATTGPIGGTIRLGVDSIGDGVEFRTPARQRLEVGPLETARLTVRVRLAPGSHRLIARAAVVDEAHHDAAVAGDSLDVQVGG